MVCDVDVVFAGAALFGRGLGPIFLDQLRCEGNESRLIDCRSSGPGVHTCTHLQDAGVRCKGEWEHRVSYVHVHAAF